MVACKSAHNWSLGGSSPVSNCCSVAHFRYFLTLLRLAGRALAMARSLAEALAAPQFARSADELLPGLRGVSWN